MQHADAITTLAAILKAENAALERNDPASAVAMLDRKLAATKALSADQMSADEASIEQLTALHELATENQALLKRAIDIQSRIIDMVVHAAQATPQHSRYGAAGRTVRQDGAVAIARQA